VLEAPTDGQSYERQNSVWVPSVGFAQGFVNKLRNGTFDVWQRGTSITCPVSTLIYTADGWQVWAGGAGVTAQQGVTANTGTWNALQIIGAAGVTAVHISQRLESNIAISLANNRATFSAWVHNNTGATITPTLYVDYPTARDNFAATTGDGSFSLQPCANGAWTRVAYTWTVNGNAWAGYEIQLLFGAVVAGQDISVTACDLRATPGLAVGLQANPPPPELRDIATETVICQRYYEAVGLGICMFSGNVTSGSAYYSPSAFKVVKRATPTIVYTDIADVSFAPGVPTSTAVGTWGLLAQKTANATAAGYYQFQWTASAEL
jgi:hypothetical protein